MAIIYDLYIDAGATFNQFFDLAGDQTGITISSVVKDSTGAAASNTTTWTDQANGQFQLTITDEITSTMSAGVGYFNIELDDAGEVNRIIQGRVYVDKDVRA